MSAEPFDMIVIGSGPAGQKAAIQASNNGRRVVLIEKTRQLGGGCVQRGTIPSKTLRENALRVRNMRKNAELANFQLPEQIELSTLIDRLGEVVKAHDSYMRRQLDRSKVLLLHGRAHFISKNQLQVEQVNGVKQRLQSDIIIIATGSKPRQPENIAVDHEHILDSDSILSMLYIPKSLTVLGGGVIASEYASIFQTLGVAVTMVDKYPRPLGFLDEDLSSAFIDAFTSMGGKWIGNTEVARAYWNDIDLVVTECEDGRSVTSEKLLCAAGRIANVENLAIANAGLSLNNHGLIAVDENLQTDVMGVFAAGDVIGPPSLASASMEQGRRASRNSLGVQVGRISATIPTGIYSIPELSSVGLSETQARKIHGKVLVGKASFDEVARGQISGDLNGMLKIVCDEAGQKVLGVMAMGEGATELIHIGQMALLAEANVDIFVETIFNFPTLAEAYRIAALEVIYARENNP
ncbi:MAG: Si-specific NAD(P)(+) transhydrogenase [Cellvibrionaceae bacterium]|nr:Si-specific NAD(P)(+) transhydrogenase [Cellvibrionaceae bacterium]